MPIRFQKFITRQDLRNDPDTLYVFGDNIQRVGYGGQAAEMRGEPNAVGIPTKMSPYVYFSNDDYFYAVQVIAEEFAILYYHLKKGGDVVWPEDGIGTGLADLKNKAPLIHIFIDESLTTLQALFTEGLN